MPAFNTRPTIALLAFLCFLLSACAGPSPAEKRVASEVARQEPLPPGKPMAEARQEILFENESLNPLQRERLRELHARSSRQAKALREEISKHQLVLMKDLVNPDKKDGDIEILKRRIVELEKKRTRNFLRSLDEAKSILGRRNSEDERFYRAFLMEPLDPEIAR